MIWLVIIFAASIVMQFVFGNIEPAMFAFPLSGAFALLVGYMSFAAERFTPKRGGWSLTSQGAAYVAFAAVICVSLIVGLTAQVSSFDVMPESGVAGRLGLHRFTASWIFTGVTIYFLVVLGAVIFRRLKYRLSLHNLSFMLNHAGLWIAVAAAVFGSADTTESRAAVYRNRPVDVSYVSVGEPHSLPFNVTLNDFNVKLHKSGEPLEFKADVMFSSDSNSETAEIKVNHPYRYDGYDIYLLSYDTAAGSESAHCILQFIRQPWSPAIYAGIFIMLAGALMMFVTGLGKRRNYELG